MVRRRGTREAVKVQGRVASTYSCTRVGKEGEAGCVDSAEALVGVLLRLLPVDAAGRGRRVGGMSAVWRCKVGKGGRGGRGGQSEAKSGASVRVVCLVWDRPKKMEKEEGTLAKRLKRWSLHVSVVCGFILQSSDERSRDRRQSLTASDERDVGLHHRDISSNISIQ